MEVAGTRSWRISEDRWSEAFDLALWFRAVERIDAPAGGIVPGPAEIDPLPGPSAAPAEQAELAAGWLAWWHALAEVPPLRGPLDPSRPPPDLVFMGPNPGPPGGGPARGDVDHGANVPQQADREVAAHQRADLYRIDLYSKPEAHIDFCIA